MNKLNLFMNFTERYRRILYLLHGKSTKGIMNAGDECQIDDPTYHSTHGDVVHPCVRYIEEGFEGHKWWLVYTPLYAGDDSLENPRLCYADAEDGEAPTDWKFYCIIKDRPESGYNSDPTMFFKDEKLYVFWRECDTPKTKELGCSHATMGCYVKNKTVTYLEKPLMTENNASDDKEVCPTIIANNNAFTAYAMHLSTPMPKFIKYLPSRIGSLIYRHHLLAIAEGLGLYDSAKNRGIAIWEGKAIEDTFQYMKTVKFKNVSSLYQPWHMDIFADEITGDQKHLYAIVQSRIKFADLCLAYSEDGEHFSFFKKPLITNRTIGMTGMYKPTSLVVHGKFYLFYTARDNEDHHLNRLFITSEDWTLLIDKLK